RAKALISYGEIPGMSIWRLEQRGTGEVGIVLASESAGGGRVHHRAGRLSFLPARYVPMEGKRAKNAGDRLGDVCDECDVELPAIQERPFNDFYRSEARPI